MVHTAEPISAVRMKLLDLSSTRSMKMPAGIQVADQMKLIGMLMKYFHCSSLPIHVQKNRHVAVYVPPVGMRHARHWMNWSAEGMMTVAKGVIVIHHCRSFQSVQKSQSPAKSRWVMFAAAPTTKPAVTQNMKSHFRSANLYGRSRSSLSLSASRSMVVVVAISQPRPRREPPSVWAAGGGYPRIPPPPGPRSGEP